MKKTQIVLGILFNKSKEVLITLRSELQSSPGLWEFPGGKVEIGENLDTALKREMREELGINIIKISPLIQVSHRNSEESLSLNVYEILSFTGTPTGLEKQPLVWSKVNNLINYNFPEANLSIIDALLLPKKYMFIPLGEKPCAVLSNLKKALETGIKLICLQAPGSYNPEFRDLATDIVGLCANGVKLMIQGPSEWLGDFPYAGWQLSSDQLYKYASKGRFFPIGRSLSASCHNAEEIALASKLNVNFLTLSPVLPTTTHPEASPIGWDTSRELIRKTNKPVFLMGGLSPKDIEQALLVGAQGVAGIREFWPGKKM